MITEELREIIGCGDCSEHKCDGAYCLKNTIDSLKVRLVDLEDENMRLREWKESAQAVEREWDAQAIAKMLGAQPGQSCRAVIAEKVPQLIAKLAGAKSENARLRHHVSAALDAVRSGLYELALGALDAALTRQEEK